jgi:hypothetical protein
MRVLTLAVFAICAAASSAIAYERVPAERWTRPFSASPSEIPTCDSPGVLSTLQSRFTQTESEYWASSLFIVSFERVRPIGFRPWGLDFVPRLFCSGVVTTSDGVRRQIDYSVIEDGGMIGASWGVEWCVGGLDRSLAYAPNCKMARP